MTTPSTALPGARRLGILVCDDDAFAERLVKPVTYDALSRTISATCPVGA